VLTIRLYTFQIFNDCLVTLNLFLKHSPFEEEISQRIMEIGGKVH
jgi:hypothetical protein